MSLQQKQTRIRSNTLPEQYRAKKSVSFWYTLQPQDTLINTSCPLITPYYHLRSGRTLLGLRINGHSLVKGPWDLNKSLRRSTSSHLFQSGVLVIRYYKSKSDNDLNTTRPPTSDINPIKAEDNILNNLVYYTVTDTSLIPTPILCNWFTFSSLMVFVLLIGRNIFQNFCPWV